MQLDAYAFTCDYTDEEKVKEAAVSLQDDIGHVDIVVNNAVIMHCKNLLELKEAQIRNSFDVNVLSSFWVSHLFAMPP